MSEFSQFYQKHVYKKTAGERIGQIDFLINELDAKMQAVVDPTAWRHLLDEKAALEEERKALVARYGEFKMAE